VASASREGGPEAAVEKIKSMLIEEAGLRAINEWVGFLPEARRTKLLAQARRRDG
jgi:hypothetical protein